MTRTDPAWDEIGIDPTPDQRAIRVAYTRKLKTIDAEADPQAFIALREAYERTLMLAQWVGREDDEDEDEDFDTDDDALVDAESTVVTARFLKAGDALPEPSASAEPDMPPARSGPSPWGPITAEDAEAHGRALAGLIHGGTGRQSTDAEDAAMLEHWRVLAADPRMQQLDFYADAGGWFAVTLAGTAPFSDVLVTPVVEFFGWGSDEGTITQTREHAIVLARYRMLAFLREAKRPGSEHHEAWQELVRPLGPDDRRGKISIKKVHRLIGEVRNYYPALEGCFDPERVALWNPRSGESSEPRYVSQAPPRHPLVALWQDMGYLGRLFLLLFAILVVHAIAQPGGVRSPGSTIGGLPEASRQESEGLSIPGPDIDRVLEADFGADLNIAKLEMGNRSLYNRLVDVWGQARDRKFSRGAFEIDLRNELDRWYRNGVQHGSKALLRDYQYLNLATAQSLKGEAAACSNFLSGDYRLPFYRQRPDELRAQEQRVKVRALLETNGARDPAKERSFSIPGTIFEAARKRSGLGLGRMQAAMTLTGDPADRCAGRLALLQAALEATGPEATALLRTM